MPKDVTAKVTKSAGTETPTENPERATKGRKPVPADERTLTIRGAKRSNWALMLAALDGSADAIARLFGTVPPIEPVAPILSNEDRTDNAKVLAHVDALNAYALAVRDYPAALDAFTARNVARTNLRNAINGALLEIPMRTRKGTDASADDSADEATN